MSLSKIQTELNAPKNQYNNFGKYKYRALEDITDALKPHLKEYNYSLIMSDTIEFIGDRVYVKATATLYDETMKVIASNSAYAREELSKKGMDAAQLTGATSSYARKYALNGLFAIDDSKDADHQDNREVQEKPKPKATVESKVSHNQVKLIQTRLSKLEDKEANETALKAHYKIDSWNDLPANAMTGLIDWFEKKGI